MNEYIYILRESNKRSKNYFKIGKGCDSKRKHDEARYKNIQIGNPRKLHLIEKIYHANANKLEPFFHKNLMEFRHRGEWFYLNEELLLNKIKQIKNSFKNLNSTKIKKIKSPLKHLCDPKQVKLFNKKSASIRKKNAINWAKEVNLFGLIQEAIQTLKHPNLKNIAHWLNSKKVLSRRESHWTGSNLHSQIQRLGWSWKELKNQQK
jgi:hypothetical protein